MISELLLDGGGGGGGRWHAALPRPRHAASFAEFNTNFTLLQLETEFITRVVSLVQVPTHLPLQLLHPSCCCGGVALSLLLSLPGSPPAHTCAPCASPLHTGCSFSFWAMPCAMTVRVSTPLPSSTPRAAHIHTHRSGRGAR